MQDCTEEGSEERRQELIKEYLPRVPGVAARVLNELRLPNTMMFEDVVAYGTEGLVSASIQFDASRGVQFWTFAEFKIRWACQNGIKTWLRGQRLLRQIDVAPQGAGHEAPRSAVDSYIERMSQLVLAASASELTGSSTGHLVDEAAPTPEALVAKQEQWEQLTALLQELQPRRREALIQTYLEGRPGKATAATLGIQKSGLSQLNKRTLALLRRQMEGEPPTRDEDADEPA